MTFQKFGRYEIERELGRGGMAVVYLARDPYVKRQVAVKVLPHQFTSDPQFRARFQREAEIIAALEHPHIVPIYDYGEQDEQLFLVMRYMTGGSLADHVRGGPLSTTEIARLMTPLASALDKAHAQGIIHRDLKPGNILFDGDGEPYISDFGIAKLTQGSTMLSGSALVGTPVYMSPEQWRGEKVDGRSDIYALGGMLYEMLSGRLPYEASTPAEVMFKCLMEPPPRLLDTISDLSPMLETIIARAMAKDRDERFPTAGEMARALETAVRGAPIEVATPPPAEITPEAVEAEAVAAPEGPLPAPITIIEESPATETPIALPTVVATPPPIPVAVAPEAIEAVAEPILEAPPTIAAPIEAAPLVAPVAEVEAPLAEAGAPIQAAPLETPFLETPFVEVEVPPAEAAPEASENLSGLADLTGLGPVTAEARPALSELTAEIEPMTRTSTVVTPPARPVAQRAPRPLARFALPAVGVAVIALLIVGGAVFGPGFFNTAAGTPTAMSAAIVEASPSPTLTISSTPTLPPTLTPTITPTRTPRPTPTPELPTTTSTSAASPDTGTVEGRTIWNGQPFAGVTVKLCTKLTGNGIWNRCETAEYSAVSDAEGNYTITGIPPGDYYHRVKMPDRIGEVAPLGDQVIKVIAGQTTTVEDAPLFKQDLLLISPAHGATVNSTTPTLSWKAYPGATEYDVVILCTDAGGARSGEVHEHGITTTQWTVTPPLPGGVTCDWGMGASGPNGGLAGSRFYRFTVP